jgi:hypothetical protein
VAAVTIAMIAMLVIGCLAVLAIGVRGVPRAPRRDFLKERYVAGEITLEQFERQRELELDPSKRTVDPFGVVRHVYGPDEDEPSFKLPCIEQGDHHGEGLA